MNKDVKERVLKVREKNMKEEEDGGVREKNGSRI